MRGVGVDITILEGRRERVNSLDVCLVGNACWIVDWVGNFMGIFEVRVGGGGVQSAPWLGDGHFGHARFKFFSFFDFDGHLFD